MNRGMGIGKGAPRALGILSCLLLLTAPGGKAPERRKQTPPTGLCAGFVANGPISEGVIPLARQDAEARANYLQSHYRVPVIRVTLDFHFDLWRTVDFIIRERAGDRWRYRGQDAAEALDQLRLRYPFHVMFTVSDPYVWMRTDAWQILAIFSQLKDKYHIEVIVTEPK